MPTFGFSAFLKLISLNDRPRRTAIRDRLLPSSDGYDFHRSLKQRASRFLVDGEPMADVMASVGRITRAPEQNSARAALERLETWRSENPGAMVPYSSATYESPGGLFKVVFTPDFGLRLGTHDTAVHIWNTAKPALASRTVYAALSLFPGIYANADGAPDDLALLSLREPPHLYRLSDGEEFAAVGARIAGSIEEIFREERDELGLPPPGQPRPNQPPAAIG